jgi:hypothetical protein
MIMKRPFGRGWAWKDKPQCHFDPTLARVVDIPSDFDLTDEINLMQRYHMWAQYLGIPTYLEDIIDVLKDFPKYLRQANLTSVRVA